MKHNDFLYSDEIVVSSDHWASIARNTHNTVVSKVPGRMDTKTHRQLSGAS
jgi:hypothetical protein